MTTTYRLKVEDLSIEVINSIKEAFKGKSTIEITVTEAMDETDYILASEANARFIYDSTRELQNGEGTSFSVEELRSKYGSNEDRNI